MEGGTNKGWFDQDLVMTKENICESLRALGRFLYNADYRCKTEEIDILFDEIEAVIMDIRSNLSGITPQKHIELFRKSFEEEYTWLNGFMRNVDRFPDKEAIFEPENGTRWTYSELNKVSNQLANAYIAAGMEKGEVVMFQLLNCPEFVFSYIACHKTGLVSTPVNCRLSSGELADTIDDSRPKIFIYGTVNKDTVAEALKLSKHKPKTIIMVDGKNDEKPLNGTMLYSVFVENRSTENPTLPWRLSIYDETTRLYTSGTTGKPKGVSITSINEVLSAHDVMMHFPFSSNDKSMNTTPWFHRGGLHSGGLTPTLYAGGSVIIMRKFDAAATLRYIEEYKLTFIIGVPNVLAMLSHEQERSSYDLSSLRGIVTMGSPLDRGACIKYQRILTPNIFNGYGTTETFWNTFLRPSDLPEKAGTAGRSCTDDEVRVVKVYDERRAEPDELAMMNGKEVGEVIIKTHAKSTYFYYNNDSETERKFHNGFLYTNDLATWDESRFVSIVGRKDDMIISGGENIYPIQVEEVLSSHPKVEDCMVTAVPDSVRGEMVTAYIVKADQTVTAEELDDFCKTSNMISNYKRPRYYRFVASLPFNASGKKLRYKIKEQAKMDLINGLLVKV
jgi:acyl-CoA synthetase (AMP-forming)/AMP-acid ligase II